MFIVKPMALLEPDGAVGAFMVKFLVPLAVDGAAGALFIRVKDCPLFAPGGACVANNDDPFGAGTKGEALRDPPPGLVVFFAAAILLDVRVCPCQDVRVQSAKVS